MELNVILLIIGAVFAVIGLVLVVIFGLRYTNRDEKTQGVSIGLIGGIVLLAIGVIMFGISFFMKKKGEKKALTASGITVGTLPEGLELPKLSAGLSPTRRTLPPMYG